MRNNFVPAVRLAALLVLWYAVAVLIGGCSSVAPQPRNILEVVTEPGGSDGHQHRLTLPPEAFLFVAPHRHGPPDPGYVPYPENFVYHLGD